MTNRLQLLRTAGVLLFMVGTGYAQARLPAAEAEKLLIQKPDPAYPALAKTARIEGKVVLEIVVSETGSVSSVRVVDGNAVLQATAVEAVKAYRYRPYLMEGKPAAFKTTTEVSFKLGPAPVITDDERKQNEQYIALRNRCQDFLQRHKWKDAESACLTLSRDKKSEGWEWRDRAWIGTALLGQQRFEEALPYFNDALQTTPSNPQSTILMAHALRNVAMTQHALKNTEKAVELYKRVESIARTATADPKNLTKRDFEKLLESTLKLHELADRNADTATVFKAIEKELETGPW